MANEALLKANKFDDFQTPPKALTPLLPYLPKDWVIWECACGRGFLTKYLVERGYQVISSDILTGSDFLGQEVPAHYDCIVTNPPYTLKDAFLQRCYTLGKPFALLLPLTTLEGKRQLWLQTFGVEILLLNKRVNFITPSGEGSGAWFATAWFTKGLNMGKQLNYGRIENG